jgi:hypothetical protein
MLHLEAVVRDVRAMLNTAEDGSGVEVWSDGTVALTSAKRTLEPEKQRAVDQPVAKFIAGQDDLISDQEIEDRISTGEARTVTTQRH